MEMEKSLRGIFHNGYEDYHRTHGVSFDQHTAAHAIMNCCTEAAGSTEWICPQDATVVTDQHCCRHRSCPRCHSARTSAWLAMMAQRLLPCDHFHVVFTLPHELNALWHYNRPWCSDRLLRAAAETLQQLLSDGRHLGAVVGILGALHTWGRTLSFHPHAHLLVSGGGLAGDAWKGAVHDYLLPVAVIKAKFRGKWLAWLNNAYEEGTLKLPPHWDEERWLRTLRKIAKQHWNVRIQGAYRQGQGVATYLARYARGGPIKDYRLIHVTPGCVAFRYRSHRDGEEHSMALDTTDFIDRVLWHVPPKRMHTLRYYGLYVPNAQVKRNRARERIGYDPEAAVRQPKRERTCPHCGHPLRRIARQYREISITRCRGVQQSVQAAVNAPTSGGALSPRGSPPFFLRSRAAA